MFPGFVFLCLAFLHFFSPETLGRSPDNSPKFPPGRREVDGGWDLSALLWAGETWECPIFLIPGKTKLDEGEQFR
jgi:hypothetical protein